MRSAKQIKELKCMGCGATIASGFFCQKCVELGAVEQPKEAELWKGRRFTEERKRKVRQQMLRDDLMSWSKRVAICLIAGLAFLGGWKVFGDQITVEFKSAASVFKPADRADPTNAHPVQLDSKGNPVGTSSFSGKYNR